MSGHTDMVLVDENGMRIDGRTAEEHRNIKIEAGVLSNADGSAYVEIGKNKVLAAVYGPRECHPRHLQNPSKAIIQCKYNTRTDSARFASPLPCRCDHRRLCFWLSFMFGCSCQGTDII